MNVNSLNELLVHSKKPIIVDFWAPWYGPCRIFDPTLKASARQHLNQVIHV
ncbi:hypothetical protein ICN40_09345 [Polynucleobacter sp. Fuers-14]|nr:hypothetical protein [Polynucleobacter sp. Fuers-14]